jgi:hypothetical protein
MKSAASNHAVWTAHSPSLRGAMVAMWRAVSADLFNTYRPEKHYMRGPGPKWHARHGQSEPPGSEER